LLLATAFNFGQQSQPEIPVAADVRALNAVIRKAGR
jgi:hypothetical protein